MRSIQETLGKRFVERAKALGYRGKRRDEALLDYWCGIVATLEALGHKEEAQHLAQTGIMILSVRGYTGLLDFVVREEAS